MNKRVSVAGGWKAQEAFSPDKAWNLLRGPFFFLNLFNLFLAMLGLLCARAFSSCSERGLLFVVVHGLLIVVASLCCRARALGTWASVVVSCRL